MRSRFLAIAPGPAQSALVVMEGGRPVRCELADNQAVRHVLLEELSDVRKTHRQVLRKSIGWQV